MSNQNTLLTMTSAEARAFYIRLEGMSLLIDDKIEELFTILLSGKRKTQILLEIQNWAWKNRFCLGNRALAVMRCFREHDHLGLIDDDGDIDNDPPTF